MGTLATSTPGGLLRDYLLAGGRASLFTGWEFKIGKLPPKPDQVIAVMTDGGVSSFPHLLVDYINVQFIIRGASAGDGYNVSYLMARKVRDLLLGMPGHPTEFSELDGITERGGIVPLSYDDGDRHLWSWNARLIVEPASNALTNRVSL